MINKPTLRQVTGIVSPIVLGGLAIHGAFIMAKLIRMLSGNSKVKLKNEKKNGK